MGRCPRGVRNTDLELGRHETYREIQKLSAQGIITEVMKVGRFARVLRRRSSREIETPRTLEYQRMLAWKAASLKKGNCQILQRGRKG